MIIFVWVLFCIIFGESTVSFGLVSGLFDNALSALVGVAFLAYGWVYQSYWSRVQEKGVVYYFFSFVYWPASPIVYVLIDDTFSIDSKYIYLYLIIVISISLIFRGRIFRVFENIIDKNSSDIKRMKDIRKRLDILLIDVMYWVPIFILALIF